MNVRLETEGVPSVVSEEEMEIVTSSSGSEFKPMPKTSVTPCSVVIKPEIGTTTIPAVSSSRLMPEMSDGFRRL